MARRFRQAVEALWPLVAFWLAILLIYSLSACTACPPNPQGWCFFP